MKELDVAFVPYHYVLNGVEYLDDMFEEHPAKDFYGAIDKGAMPTTSQITVDDIVAVVEPILKAGFDVLHIEFSSGLTSSWLATQAAQEKLSEKYPERKFYIADSLSASSGYGLLIEKTVQMKNEGLSIEELRDWVESNKLKARHWFFSTDLRQFKRGGRLSAPAAMVAAALRIVPMMEVTGEGKLVVRKRLMGKKAAMREALNLMKAEAQNGTDYDDICIVNSSDREDDAKALVEMIKAEFKNLKDIKIYNIGPVIGTHTGPGTVSLFFMGNEDRPK